MKDHADANSGSEGEQSGGEALPGGRPHSQGRRPGGTAPGDTAANERGRGAFIDAWVVIDLVLHRWCWLCVGAVVGLAAFFAAGRFWIRPGFTATAQLLRYETPATSDFLKTTPLSPDTFASLIESPELLREVGTNAVPPVPPEKLLKRVKVDPQEDSDVVLVSVSAEVPAEAMDLANIYAGAAVAYTTELQGRQAAVVAEDYLQKQVAAMDREIMALHDQFLALPASSHLTNKLAQVGSDLAALSRQLSVSPQVSVLTAKLSEKLQQSLADLSDLTLKYTDAHPLVQEKRAQIAALRRQILEASTNAAAVGGVGADSVRGFVIGPDGKPMMDPDYEVIEAHLRSLEDARTEIASRQREAELYASQPPGIVRVLAPANAKTVQSNHRRIKIGLLTIFGGGFGMGCSLLLVLLVEAFARRLKTAADVKRITRLPVLTTLGNLDQMQESSRAQWAFRTWTMLQGRLSRSANHGLVCGITSSTAGEGRSTWIRLLAEAASLTGFRVLTIATRPSASHAESRHEFLEERVYEPPDMTPRESNPETALTSNVLASPSQVTDRLTGPNSPPVVHIPLPGWVWNLERRKQWREALSQWRRIDNLVIFVELPPASVPEAVLLGSNLPNMLWLAESGAADAAETRTQLETLRHARCNLVGAVLNREAAKSIKRLFPRWVAACCVLAVFSLCLCSASAQEPGTNSPAPASMAPAPEPAATNLVEKENGGAGANKEADLSFSAGLVARASWQQHFTLGPGDVLTFELYGDPTLTRQDIPIGPDGRVSYLEAQDVLAEGLTVDELRARLDGELGKYRRAPHTMLVPVAYRSKKYFVLGQVVQRGVYTLDRPITILEAIARARGIENGQVDVDTVDLADLGRAFLSRRGKRVPVDFEKLFGAGDFSQNVELEPGDYLYFPSADLKQVYVLGEVALPGPVTYRPDLTAIDAISARGGFTEKAFKSRLLVVRGSLGHPQMFVVNGLGVFDGRTLDFKLQPKDIVYVSWRPFSYGEDLLDEATTAFVQAIVTSWVGADIVKPTK